MATITMDIEQSPAENLSRCSDFTT